MEPGGKGVLAQAQHSTILNPASHAAFAAPNAQVVAMEPVGKGVLAQARGVEALAGMMQAAPVGSEVRADAAGV